MKPRNLLLAFGLVSLLLTLSAAPLVACDYGGGAFSFTQAYAQPVVAQQFVQSYSMPVQQVVVQRQFRQRVVQPVVVRRGFYGGLRIRAPFVSVGW